MEGKYVGLHIKDNKPCGMVMERERNKGKYGTKSYHWICDTCGKEPDTREIKQ